MIFFNTYLNFNLFNLILVNFFVNFVHMNVQNFRYIEIIQTFLTHNSTFFGYMCEVFLNQTSMINTSYLFTNSFNLIYIMEKSAPEKICKAWTT